MYESSIYISSHMDMENCGSASNSFAASTGSLISDARQSFLSTLPGYFPVDPRGPWALEKHLTFMLPLPSKAETTHGNRAPS